VATLSESVKAFVVQRLACFGTPSEVADAVKEEFGIAITRQHVASYDPEKACKTRRWVELHAATRRAFLDQTASIAIVHQSWRLEQLEDMTRRAKKQKNYKLAAELLEQAAKEEGGFYRNPSSAPGLTDEQRVERMQQMFAEMDAATGLPQRGTPRLALA
jgi:hypothetical protein